MRTRQGETICLGEWIRPASADFPPAGGVWGGMRAGFGTDLFSKSPPFKFRSAKYAAKKFRKEKGVVFAPPTRAHTTSVRLPFNDVE